MAASDSSSLMIFFLVVPFARDTFRPWIMLKLRRRTELCLVRLVSNMRFSQCQCAIVDRRGKGQRKGD